MFYGFRPRDIVRILSVVWSDAQDKPQVQHCLDKWYRHYFNHMQSCPIPYSSTTQNFCRSYLCVPPWKWKSTNIYMCYVNLLKNWLLKSKFWLTDSLRKLWLNNNTLSRTCTKKVSLTFIFVKTKSINVKNDFKQSIWWCLKHKFNRWFYIRLNAI